MPSSALASQSVTLSDSAGNTVTLALEPGTVLSGLSTVAAGGETLATLLMEPGGTSLTTQSGSGNTASLGCVAGASGTVTASVTNFLGLTGAVTVGVQQVTVSTSPSGSTVTVTHNLGFVSTVTPDPSNGGSTAFTTQGSSNKAEFYGIGVLRDAQTSAQQNAAVQCAIPLPSSLPGTTLVLCHVDITIVCKCTVAGPISSTGQPLPPAGAYFIQRGYSDWVNNNGTITPANLSLTAQGSPSFVTNPIYTVTEERESVFQLADGNYISDIGPVTGQIVAASSDSLLLSVVQAGFASLYFFGTTVCEIFATVTYN